MDSTALIDHPEKFTPKPVIVVFGDEEFLKRRALHVLRTRILGTEDDAFGYSSHAGDKATFGAVRDELATVAFLSPCRMVVVENADPFVTKYRAQLEKFVAEPVAQSVLVLDVKTWASNTKLAKLVPADATIVCKAPQSAGMQSWCVQWAKNQHNKQLAQDAARLLVDLIGSDMGLLHQEIAKLAVYVGDLPRISAADVDKLVGNNQAENTWKIFDAIGAGNARLAFQILERVLSQGDDPIKVLGAFSLQLRRLAQVARLSKQGTPLSAAMARCGVPPFATRGVEQQLRHLGAARIGKLYDWLVEADSGMKGGSPLPARTILERLVVELSRKVTPARN